MQGEFTEYILAGRAESIKVTVIYTRQRLRQLRSTSALATLCGLPGYVLEKEILQI